MAARLWHNGYARIIGVLRGTTAYGYCGFEFGRDLLICGGVRENAIEPIDILFEDTIQANLNTYTEGKGLCHQARRLGWKTIIVCAPFFHQIRASSTFISRLWITNQDLWIFNQPAEPDDWNKRMKHSQGIVEGDLIELLLSELGRLFLYHDKGDIRSCRDLLDYYDRRDKAHLPVE